MKRKAIKKALNFPADLRQQALALVSGNPLLTRELVASDADSGLIERLCWAAGVLHDHEQIDVLLYIIESGQPSESTAIHAAGALQPLCSRRTTRRLLAVVRDRRRPVELRRAAIYALVFLCDRRAVECIGWASREPELCDVGVLALGQMVYRKAARRHLEWHSRHGDATTRERADHHLTCMAPAATEGRTSDHADRGQTGNLLESRKVRQEGIVSMTFHRLSAGT